MARTGREGERERKGLKGPTDTAENAAALVGNWLERGAASCNKRAMALRTCSEIPCAKVGCKTSVNTVFGAAKAKTALNFVVTVGNCNAMPQCSLPLCEIHDLNQQQQYMIL